MTIELPWAPPAIRRLPRDARGYPVPRFVQWLIDGKPAPHRGLGAEPDFRYADPQFREQAFCNRLCWICGEKLGPSNVYAIGPMCVVNRTTSEPASHRRCAGFAVHACPFLTKPRMRRNEKDLDPEAFAPGTPIPRNPGCVCLYQTNSASRFEVGNGDWLIKLGRPQRIEWFAKGRPATRVEVIDSINSGYPLLMEEAKKDGKQAIFELGALLEQALRLVPRAA